MIATAKTALYIRLSREDGDKDVSESIKNQKDLLVDYTAKYGIADYEIYVDDGYSGLNFDRPGFNRMIADIEAGKIDTVITKDLSRLGRDYISVGEYIERYFPLRGVNYIAINDNVTDDMMPFKVIFNDMYAKDISKKVRTALNTKKKNGAFIGSVAPYGYKKNPENHNKLLIDDETAPYVRRIFDLFLGGTAILTIANKLTSEGVPTPSQSKPLKATQKRHKGLWNDAIIKRILENPTYIGCMTQNRSRKVNYKLDKKIRLPKEDWIMVENTHDPIIPKEDFETAQEMLAVRSYDNKNRNGKQHLLTGIAFCADCGSPMATIKESPTRYYLVCRTWRRHAKLGLCTSHCIREDVVISEIREQLKHLAQRFINTDLLLQDCEQEIKGENSFEKRLVLLEKKLAENQMYKLSLYKSKARGELSEADYDLFSKEIEREGQEISVQIENLKKHQNELQDIQALRETITALLTFEKLDRKSLVALVGRIEIGKDKEIVLALNFPEPK